jgi:DNA-binding NtrC family response regulator
MAVRTPTILVVVDDWDERAVIASVLREVGFGVVAAAHDRGARAAMTRQGFAAAVIALRDSDAVGFLRHARRWQPGLKALIVIEPTATQFVDADDDTLVPRPFDPRRLLGYVLELVLNEDERGVALHHSHAAEFAIAAAKLACLASRRAAAAAAGANRLAHDLTRQIGEASTLHQGLAIIR